MSSRRFSARSRALLKVAGTLTFAAWLKGHPDHWPAWWDGYLAGAGSAAHDDQLQAIRLRAAFEDGWRAGQAAERVSLEQDWSETVALLRGRVPVGWTVQEAWPLDPPSAVRVGQRRSPDVQGRAS